METAEYVRCGDGPVRKTVNKLLSLNGCSSKGARESRGKGKASLVKIPGVGWGGRIAPPVLPKVALAPPFTNGITRAWTIVGAKD